MQEEAEQLQRKYNHAKRIIAELKRHEQFLAVQLRERDHEYNSHLRLLRDRVARLEKELATTQRVAGIPVRLPDYPFGEGGSSLAKDLSPPELLKQPPVSNGSIPVNRTVQATPFTLPPPPVQIIPQDLSMDGDISEADDSSLRCDDLDSAVPFHQLLDVSAGRSKAELGRSGALGGRHKPSPDALRTAILKRSVSASRYACVVGIG